VIDREVINQIIQESKDKYTRPSSIIDEHDALFVKYFSEDSE